MAFKNEWKNRTDGEVAFASHINMIANEVIRLGDYSATKQQFENLMNGKLDYSEQYDNEIDYGVLFEGHLFGYDIALYMNDRDYEHAPFDLGLVFTVQETLSNSMNYKQLGFSFDDGSVGTMYKRTIMQGEDPADIDWEVQQSGGSANVEEFNEQLEILKQLVPALETFQSTLETATNNANTATTNANEAAAYADTKASWAEAATTFANQAAGLADDMARAAAEAVDEIRTAKENGEFDGKTPVKGTDYFTEEDKQEIVDAVVEEIGGSTTVVSWLETATKNGSQRYKYSASAGTCELSYNSNWNSYTGSVNAGEIYHVVTYTTGNSPAVAFFDANGAFITCVPFTDAVTAQLYDIEVTVPEGAVTMGVNEYPSVLADTYKTSLVVETEVKTSGIVSPTISVEEIEGGNRLTITDANGTQTVDVMNGTGGDSVPDYVKAEAKEVARKVIEKQTINSLVLLMGADIHVSTSSTVRTAIEHMGMGIKEIKKYITPDCVAYLGDYNYGVTPTSLEQGIDCMMFAKKCLEGDIWMTGNHDYYAVSSSDPDIFTDDMSYAFVGSHNTDKAVVDVDNLVRNYGYVDYEKQRIRLIYLNTTDITGVDYTSHLVSTVQGQWLVNTALDLSDKEDEEKWGVVVLTHVPAFENPQLPTVLGNFKDKTSGSNFGVSYDFSTTKADLIATFHGHIHNFKVTDMTTTAGNVIKAICIPNAVPGRENPYTGDRQEVDSNGNPVSYPKTAGTAEETSFNAVVIDKDNKKIHAICYGAGYDREILYTEAGVTPSPEPDEEVINQIPISTDASGAVYNGTGYKDGVRLGSDGTDRTGAPTDATGFIPCVKGDVLYLKNCQILNDGNTGDVYQFLGCYKSDKTFIKNVNLATSTLVTKDENNFVTSINTAVFGEQYDNMAFVRVCGNYIGADSIITKNQPIE